MSDGQVLVGRYRLIRELGAGAMGTVWLAQDSTLKRQVAVKRVTDPLTPQLGRQAEMARLRAMREGRVAARLNHPNAVGIYDVAIHEGEPWLVMEYVPSRTLTDIVQTHGPIPPQRAALLGTQIASALAEAHRVGIVHRDVKPSNLLLTEEGEAKLTDFGIARSGGDATLTASGLVTGTPAYFAPELARGADPNPASDVWSLGATLYFAVEGTPPFGSDDNPLVLLGRIANQPVPPPARAGELTTTIMRLLDRDASWRPGMVEARSMLAALSKGTETIPLALLQEELDTEQDGPSDDTSEFPAVPAFDLPSSVSWTRHETNPERGGDLDDAVEDPRATPEPDADDAATMIAPVAAAGGEPTDGAPEDTSETQEEPVQSEAAAGPGVVDDDPPDPGTMGEGLGEKQDDEQDEKVTVLATARTEPERAEGAGASPTAGVTDTDEPATDGTPVPPGPPARRPRRRTRVLLTLVVAVFGVLGSYLIANAVTAPDDEPQASDRHERRTEADDDSSEAREKANEDGTRDSRGADEPDNEPTPSPTPTPEPEKKEKPKKDQPAVRMTAPQMTRMVSQYYAQLPSDTDASWRMLSPTMQQSTGRGAYDGWWALVRSVRASGLQADRGDATVTVRVSYQMNDGASESEVRQLGLIISEDGERLLVDTDTRR